MTLITKASKYHNVAFSRSCFRLPERDKIFPDQPLLLCSFPTFSHLLLNLISQRRLRVRNSNVAFQFNPPPPRVISAHAYKLGNRYEMWARLQTWSYQTEKETEKEKEKNDSFYDDDGAFLLSQVLCISFQITSLTLHSFKICQIHETWSPVQ